MFKPQSEQAGLRRGQTYSISEKGKEKGSTRCNNRLIEKTPSQHGGENTFSIRNPGRTDARRKPCANPGKVWPPCHQLDSQPFCHAFAKLGISFGEVLNHALLDRLVGFSQRIDYVINQMVLIHFAK